MRVIFSIYIYCLSVALALFALGIMLANSQPSPPENSLSLIELTGTFILAAVVMEFWPFISVKAIFLSRCYKTFLAMLAFLLILKKIIWASEAFGIALGILYILICGYFGYYFGHLKSSSLSDDKPPVAPKRL